MNARQAKWIVEKLCPFVLRDQGRGFCMDIWRQTRYFGETIERDGIKRRPPSCGTISCIGGSIEFLKGTDDSADDTDGTGRLIGLSPLQTDVLFMGWVNEWPRDYSKRYRRARSALAKARVVVSLLKLVAKTRGKCLGVVKP